MIRRMTGEQPRTLGRLIWTGVIALLTVLSVVALLGNTAHANDLPDWRGVITSRPAGNTGVWVVGGRSFTANSATSFDTVEGPLNVGACAKVRYFTSGSTDIADEIDSEPAGDCGSATGTPSGTPSSTPSGTPSATPSGTPTPALQIFRGVLNSRPDGNTGTWVVGGRAFVANTFTEFDTVEGPLSVGSCVKVRFYSSGGVDTADEIDSEPPSDCSLGATPGPTSTSSPTPGTPVPTNEFRGFIQSRPEGLLGTWVVGGRSFVASNSSEFKIKDGPLTVGACAKVDFYTLSGVDMIREIESESGDDCAGTGPRPSSTPDSRDDRDETKIYAPIDSIPAAPYVGTWTIGGIAYQANSQTEFDQDDGAFAVGACVRADFKVINGVNVLDEVETKEAYKCQGAVGEPSNLFKAYGVIDTYTTTRPSVWVVSGISYTVSASTTIEAEHGPFAVGAYVEVKYVVTNGERVATKIETHVAPGSGSGNISGSLDDRPSDDWGVWTVGGQTYQGDPAIRVDVPSAALRSASAGATGQRVLVNYYTVSATRYVTSVRLIRGTAYMPVIQR